MYRVFTLVLALLLELAAIAALAWWGLTIDAAIGFRLLAGIGTPAIAIMLWAFYAAPRARYKIPVAAFAVKILVYAAATLALAAVGHITLAVVFLALVLLVTGLIRLGRLDEGVGETR